METQLRTWLKDDMPRHKANLEQQFAMRKLDLAKEAALLQVQPADSAKLAELSTDEMFSLAGEIVRNTNQLIEDKIKDGYNSNNNNNKDPFTIQTLPIITILLWMETGEIGSSVYYTRALYEDFWRVFVQHIRNRAIHAIDELNRWNPKGMNILLSKLTVTTTMKSSLFRIYIEPTTANSLPIYRLFRYVNILIDRGEMDPNREHHQSIQMASEGYKRKREIFEADEQSLRWLCGDRAPLDELIVKIVTPKLAANERLVHKKRASDTSVSYIKSEYPSNHHNPIMLRIAQAQDAIRSLPEINDQTDTITLCDQYAIVLKDMQDKTEGVSLTDYKATMQKTASFQPPSTEYELPPIKEDPTFEQSLYDIDQSIRIALEEILNTNGLITGEEQRNIIRQVKDRFLRGPPEPMDPDAPYESIEQSIGRRLLEAEVASYQIHVAKRMMEVLNKYRPSIMGGFMGNEDRQWVESVVGPELDYQCEENGGANQFMAGHDVPWITFRQELRDRQQKVHDDQITRLQQRMETLTWTNDTLKNQILTQHQKNLDRHTTDINNNTAFPAAQLNRYQNNRIPVSWLSPLIPSLAKTHKEPSLTCSEAYRALIEQGVVLSNHPGP